MTTLLHKVQQPIAQCELSSARKKLFPLNDGLIMPFSTSPFFEIFIVIIAVGSRCKVWSTTPRPIIEGSVLVRLSLLLSELFTHAVFFQNRSEIM